MFDSLSQYAHVEIYNCLKLFTIKSLAQNNIIKGADICNAHLYADVDRDIY